MKPLIPYRLSLRLLVALGVAVPVFVGLAGLSVQHYARERHLAEDQIRMTAVQLGEILLGSLRHAMFDHNRAMLMESLQAVGQMEMIDRVRLVNPDGWVMADSQLGARPEQFDQEKPGCMECHQIAEEERPRTLVLPTDTGTLRIAVPVPNAEDCQVCHASDETHLGMMLIDAPLIRWEEHVEKDLGEDILLAGFITLLVTLVTYWGMHALVVRRVESFGAPLAQFAQGDFRVRLPTRKILNDEINGLAVAFNQMAEALGRHAREEAQRRQTRQQAIAEERGRLARELHDRVAQVLGYVNTKSMAVQLLLKDGHAAEAHTGLSQLQEAVQLGSLDVREAILGLKSAGQIHGNLAHTLRDYAAQFTRLTDLPVKLEADAEAAQIPLQAETRLQLLRIVQEALSNIRKHAVATTASLTLWSEAGTLYLTIADDGIGFDPQTVSVPEEHIGLAILRERAAAVGGEVTVTSALGHGTEISIAVPLERNTLITWPNAS